MPFGGRWKGDAPKLMMTPMIDVVFQLLIFFLVGAKFRVPEGELAAYLPPEGPAVEKPKPPPPDADEIRVTLRVTQESASNPKVAPKVTFERVMTGEQTSETMESLTAKLKALGQDARMRDKVPVVIEAEPAVAYQWVVKALDISREAKFAKVNFAASKLAHPISVEKAPPG